MALTGFLSQFPFSLLMIVEKNFFAFIFTMMLLWHLLCSGDFASPLKPHSLLSEREPSVSSIYVKKVKLSRFCCWTRGCGSYRFSHVVPFYSMPPIALSIGYLLLARGSCHADSQGMWVYCHLGLSSPQISHSDGRQSVALARQALQSKTLSSQDPVNQRPPPLSSLYVFFIFISS